jgi:predicted adenine nucleotide alpha hydrolase (AANH) superfamily ATPase
MDKLLLHACCAPCSSAVIDEYSKYFDITLYYYNPCITDQTEYYKRSDELIKLGKLYNVPVVIEDFDESIYFQVCSPLKDEPEGGKRCAVCITQRLAGAALYAKEHGFRYFSTTLTISPYKDSAVINRVGTNVGGRNGIMYMPFDFGYLFPRSLQLCEKYNLYQQDYCGCEYSK